MDRCFAQILRTSNQAVVFSLVEKRPGIVTATVTSRATRSETLDYPRRKMPESN